MIFDIFAGWHRGERHDGLDAQVEGRARASRAAERRPQGAGRPAQRVGGGGRPHPRSSCSSASCATASACRSARSREALGVSSVPVREALASLQREGVVTIEPNRGAFINGLDAGVVTEQFYVFGRIYGLAARVAAERAEPSVVAALSDLAERIAAERDLDALLDLSIQFQMMIVAPGRLEASARAHHAVLATRAGKLLRDDSRIRRRSPAAASREMAARDRVRPARRRGERMLAVHRRDRRTRRAPVSGARIVLSIVQVEPGRTRRARHRHCERTVQEKGVAWTSRARRRGRSLEDGIHPLRGERRDRDDHAEPSAGGQRADTRAARRPRRGVATGGRRSRRARDRAAGQRQALLRGPRHPRRGRRRRRSREVHGRGHLRDRGQALPRVLAALAERSETLDRGGPGRVHRRRPAARAGRAI